MNISEINLNSPLLQHHHQVVFSETKTWDSVQGSLHCYERKDTQTTWQMVARDIPIVVGKNGMAWGIGLHQQQIDNSPIKKEGDGKSPAGMFTLGTAFGFPSTIQTRLPYLQITPSLEAVDDPNSVYYNKIVDNQKVNKDWTSSEKMHEYTDLYEIGVEIKHNSNSIPNQGSCIFLHVWRTDHQGTAGCTAMSLNNLKKLVAWLDPTKNPIFIQLPSIPK